MASMKVSFSKALMALQIVFNDYFEHGGTHPLDVLAQNDGVGDEILRLFNPSWLRGVKSQDDLAKYARYQVWNDLSNGVERFKIEWIWDGEVA